MSRMPRHTVSSFSTPSTDAWDATLYDFTTLSPQVLGDGVIPGMTDVVVSNVSGLVEGHMAIISPVPSVHNGGLHLGSRKNGIPPISNTEPRIRVALPANAVNRRVQVIAELSHCDTISKNVVMIRVGVISSDADSVSHMHGCGAAAGRSAGEPHNDAAMGYRLYRRDGNTVSISPPLNYECSAFDNIKGAWGIEYVQGCDRGLPAQLIALPGPDNPITRSRQFERITPYNGTGSTAPNGVADLDAPWYGYVTTAFIGTAADSLYDAVISRLVVRIAR